MIEQKMCQMTELRLRYGISQADLAKAAGVSRQLISLIELDQDHWSKGREAMIRRAFFTFIASRRAALDGLECELEATPWLFTMSKEDDEHGF